jgi:hypothetical protein
LLAQNLVSFRSLESQAVKFSELAKEAAAAGDASKKDVDVK